MEIIDNFYCANATNTRYYICDDKKCEKRYSGVTEDSILKDVGLELQKFLLFLLLLVAQVTNTVIETFTRHNSRTIAKYRNIVMKAIIYDMEHSEDGVFEENMIGGPGVEVQVDESKFGVRGSMLFMGYTDYCKCTFRSLRNLNCRSQSIIRVFV